MFILRIIIERFDYIINLIFKTHLEGTISTTFDELIVLVSYLFVFFMGVICEKLSCILLIFYFFTIILMGFFIVFMIFTRQFSLSFFNELTSTQGIYIRCFILISPVISSSYDELPAFIFYVYILFYSILFLFPNFEFFCSSIEDFCCVIVIFNCLFINAFTDYSYVFRALFWSFISTGGIFCYLNHSKILKDLTLIKKVCSNRNLFYLISIITSMMAQLGIRMIYNKIKENKKDDENLKNKLN